MSNSSDKDYDFKVPKYGQSNSILCWLACYRMMYGWKRDPRTVRPKLEAAGIDISETYTNDKWARGRNALGLTSYRPSFLEEKDNFLWILDKHGPIWCAGRFLPGTGNMGHAVVVSGYRKRDGAIRINDPWEIAKFDSYNWMTHDKLYNKLHKTDYAVQVFR